MVNILREDFVISADSFRMLCRQCKGWDTVNSDWRPLSQIPVAANQRLADVLRAWLKRRDESFGHRVPSHFWKLPGEDPALWSANTVTTWLQ